MKFKIYRHHIINESMMFEEAIRMEWHYKGLRISALAFPEGGWKAWCLVARVAKLEFKKYLKDKDIK